MLIEATSAFAAEKHNISKLTLSKNWLREEQIYESVDLNSSTKKLIRFRVSPYENTDED